MKSNIYHIHYLLFALLLAGVLASAGCQKEKSGTPTWIEIDSLTLNAAGVQNGTISSNSKFTDAWVYVNSNLVGGFELPARIPILTEGNSNVIIFPGIQVNGLSALRSQYLKIERFEQNINLIPNQTVNLNPVFKYDSLVAANGFMYKENFEGGQGSQGLQQSVGSYGTWGIYTTSEAFEGTKCGVLSHNGAENTITQVESANWMVLPKGDVGGIFFEMNYKCNTSFTVSLLAKPLDGGATQKIGVIGISPSDEWNKIYITLSPTVNSFTTGNEFKLAIQYTRQPSITEQKVYLDNLQILY